MLGLLGSGLMWLPQPPLAWWPLAWIAPIPWLLLVRKCDLTGRWAYGSIGLAGWLFWLLTIHWIRLPHPANYLAWPALAAVMAAYLPLFIALARVGVHHFRWPLWLVAPVTWTGVEWLRAHLLSGFYMGSLCKTQIAWLPMIQVADLFGEYGVTFLIVLVAACLTQALARQGASWRIALWWTQAEVACLGARRCRLDPGSWVRPPAPGTAENGRPIRQRSRRWTAPSPDSGIHACRLEK